MPKLDGLPESAIVELALTIDPTINLKEVRPGVVRKQLEFSKEQWCRIVIAARAAAAMSPSRFIRVVMEYHLEQHTIDPQFLPPARIGVSRRAFDIGSSPARGDTIFRTDPTGVNGLDAKLIERLKP